MTGLRRHFLRHRWLAAWVVAFALLMKVLVPAGYMLGESHGAITIELCSGYGPMTMAMPGMAHQGDKSDHGKAEQTCAFAGLNAPALGSAYPPLLAAALAFIMTAAYRVVVRPSPGRSRHLRPPLRGPPLPA